MSAKQRIVLVAALTFAMAGASFFLVRSFQLKAHAQEPSGGAFTAFMVENQYQGGQAQPSHTEHYLRAVKSDGAEATVWMRQSPRQEWMQPKVILDLPKAERVSVDPFTESVTTYPLSADAVTMYGTELRSECTRQTNLERSTWLGYEVRKVHKDLPGPPGGQTSLDLFEAPGLGCFALKETWVIGPTKAPESTITREAMFVIKGEPDSSLFAIPANYAERSPSQVLEEFTRRYPEEPPLPSSTPQLLDGGYQKARQ